MSAVGATTGASNRFAERIRRLARRRRAHQVSWRTASPAISARSRHADCWRATRVDRHGAALQRFGVSSTAPAR
jgi:hypothetical protein